ncbi:MAG: PQQ-binding-like beta-propeller repeat protein, partial [Planctomycetota bacterium JB042]
MRCRAPLAALLLLAPADAGSAAEGADPPWPGFGGPGRDFRVDAPPLADAWPDGGPPVVWRRAFGEGYAGLAHDGARVFSMRRDGDADEEVVVALDAETGETAWEFRYDAPIEPDMNVEYGPGPHVTPALAGDLVVAVGVTVKVHALERTTGALRWSRDLRAEFEATHVKRGYCASPLVIGGLVILPIGGEAGALTALRRDDGEVAWRAGSFG